MYAHTQTQAQNNTLSHQHLWNPSAPGEKALLSKKVNAQQIAVSLFLAPSLSSFGLVKPSQIKSAFHQGLVIVFVRGTLVLMAFRACLSTRQSLLGSCYLLLRAGGEQIVS